MTSPVAQRLYDALWPLNVGDGDVGSPLLRLCEVVTAPVAEVDGLAADTDTQVGWGPLLDPDLTPGKALPWLGQMVGAQIPTGMVEADARFLVRHSPGWARGTPAAITAAAKLWLTGSQHVALDERHGGDAYALQVSVYEPEVIDLTGLTAAVTASLPAGISLTLNVITGWTMAQFEAAVATMSAAETGTDTDTMVEVETHLP